MKTKVNVTEEAKAKVRAILDEINHAIDNTNVKEKVICSGFTINHEFFNIKTDPPTPAETWPSGALLN